MAGALLTEALLPAQRVEWAARVLAHAARRVGSFPEVADLIKVAGAPERWSEGRARYGRLRTVGLVLRENGVDDLEARLLIRIGELTAQTVYNAGAAQDGVRFPDPAPEIAGRLRQLADAVQDPAFELRSWSALSQPGMPVY